DQAGGTAGIFDAGDMLVLQVGAKFLTFGNQQAHKDSGSSATAAAISAGQFASSGFWNNSKGQSVIQSFNGGTNSHALGKWPAANYSNLFGNAAGPMGNLAGKTNAQIVQLYKNLGTSNNGNSTSASAYTQAVAMAFGLYADTTGLGGADILSNGLAKKYNF